MAGRRRSSLSKDALQAGGRYARRGAAGSKEGILSHRGSFLEARSSKGKSSKGSSKQQTLEDGGKPGAEFDYLPGETAGERRKRLSWNKWNQLHLEVDEAGEGA